jgi:hypothetical protein
MGFKNWLEKRRWRKMLTGFALFVTLFRAGNASADWSQKTKASFETLNKYHLVFKEKKEISLEDKKQYGDLTIAFIKNLSQDILNDLRKGNYADALREYKQFQSMAQFLETIDRFDEIAPLYEELTAQVQLVLKKIQKKTDKTQQVVPSHQAVPPGKYYFNSKNFSLMIDIFYKDKALIYKANLRGFLIEDNEWETAAKGKPAEVIDLVEKTLLTPKKMHFVPRTQWK